MWVLTCLMNLLRPSEAFCFGTTAGAEKPKKRTEALYFFAALLITSVVSDRFFKKSRKTCRGTTQKPALFYFFMTFVQPQCPPRSFCYEPTKIGEIYRGSGIFSFLLICDLCATSVSSVVLFLKNPAKE